jgi:hypothetical protein
MEYGEIKFTGCLPEERRKEQFDSDVENFERDIG